MESTAQFWFDELADAQDDEELDDLSFVRKTHRKNMAGRQDMEGKQDTKRYRHIKDKRKNRIREDEIAV